MAGNTQKVKVVFSDTKINDSGEEGKDYFLSVLGDDKDYFFAIGGMYGQADPIDKSKRLPNYKLVLERIEYEKRVYQPGHFRLTSIIEDPKADLHKINKELKQIVNGDANVAGYTYKWELSADLKLSHPSKGIVTVAKDYYLYKAQIVTSEVKDGTAIKLANKIVFDFYSQDHKLTRFPSCKAWTGKRLSDQIIKPVVKAELGDENLFKLNKLCHIANGEVDLPQPYVVQYNEPFYDTIARTANRWGEFLYNEDGKLCLGIQKAPAQVNSIKATIHFGENVVSQKPSDQICYVNNPYSSSAAVAPKDANVARFYDAGFTDDSYTNIYDPSGLECKFKWLPGHGIALFSAFLSGDGLLSSVVKTGVAMATAVATTKIVGEIRNGDIKKKYSKDDYIKKTGMIAEVSKTAKSLNQFIFDIQKKESEVSSDQIALDFANNVPDLKLCDYTKVNNNDTICLVTDMCGFIETSNKVIIASHSAKVIPLTDNTPALNTIYPPLDSRPRILKAEPQEAVVADAADPFGLGRVRVRFLWQEAKENTGKDKKDTAAWVNASPWIRVTTPFAGKEGASGMVMTPEVGSHVMVNFMHGNIEMPYADGALYYRTDKEPNGSAPGIGFIDGTNKAHLMPEWKRRTISASNGQNLTFIEADAFSTFAAGMVPGATIVDAFPAAKKFLSSKIPDFGGNIVLSDKYGINSINMNNTARSITVNSPLGKVEINAFTGITISAPNGDVTIKGKNIKLEAGNNITVKSGTNVYSADDKTKATDLGAYFGGVMGAFGAEMAKITLKNKTGVDMTKVLDLKFVRSCLEVILRPVEGTLAISSRNNVIITAGKGKVKNSKAITDFWDKKVVKPAKERKGNDLLLIPDICDILYYTFFNNIHDYIGINRTVNSKYKEVIDYLRSLYDIRKTKIKIGNTECQTLDQWKDYLKKFNTDENVDINITEVVYSSVDINNNIINSLSSKLNDIKETINTTNFRAIYTKEKIKTQLIADMKSALGWLSDEKKAVFTHCGKDCTQVVEAVTNKVYAAQDGNDNLKYDGPNFRQYFVYQLIKEAKFDTLFDNPSATISDWTSNVNTETDGKTVWGTWIEKLNTYTPTKSDVAKAFVKSFGESLIGEGLQLSIDNLNGIAKTVGKDSWKVTGGDGKIFLSDQDGRTLSINDSGHLEPKDNPVEKNGLTEYLKQVVNNG